MSQFREYVRTTTVNDKPISVEADEESLLTISEGIGGCSIRVSLETANDLITTLKRVMKKIRGPKVKEEKKRLL